MHLQRVPSIDGFISAGAEPPQSPPRAGSAALAGDTGTFSFAQPSHPSPVSLARSASGESLTSLRRGGRRVATRPDRVGTDAAVMSKRLAQYDEMLATLARDPVNPEEIACLALTAGRIPHDASAASAFGKLLAWLPANVAAFASEEARDTFTRVGTQAFERLRNAPEYHVDLRDSLRRVRESLEGRKRGHPLVGRPSTAESSHERSGESEPKRLKNALADGNGLLCEESLD